MSVKDCSFCGREGLLLYPVRYAVACPAGAEKAPKLKESFLIEGAPSDVATARYTLRAIRTGYLYTYDEKRDRLKAYIVMPKGYLWKFPHNQPPPVLISDKPPCISLLDTSLSICVDVNHSDSDPAGIFWIGWSNTAWTSTLIKKVKNDEWRRKHMRSVDIPHMLTGLRDRHTGEFEKNYKNISHFSMTEKEMKLAFGYSNTPVSHELDRLAQAGTLISIFKKQTSIQKGFIVAIDDPVGITNDLSELTIPTNHSGFDAELYRGKIIEEILQSTESAVREKARREYKFDTSQKKIDEDIPSPDGVSYSDVKQVIAVLKAGGPSKLAKQKERERKKYGENEIGRQQAAEDLAWDELTTTDKKPILNAKKRSDLPALYQASLKNFEEKGIALAEVHVRWLKSEQLSNWMDGVHDSADLTSGFSYRESLGQCIGNAAATQACDKQLSAWLSNADVENHKNLYARAMLFNQTDVINSSVTEIKGGDVKLKNILSIYKQGFDRLKGKKEMRFIDRLIFIATNSMLKALAQNVDLAMKNLVLINLTLLAETVVSASTRSVQEIQNWILLEASKKGFFNAENTMGGRPAKNNVPTGPVVSPSAAYELDVAKLEQEGRISAGSMKNIKIPGYEITAKWLSSSVDFNMGSVAVFLQFAAFGFAVRDLKKGDKFENHVYLWKLGFAVMSLSGSLVELVGTVLSKAPTHPLAVAIKSHWAKGESAGAKTLAVGKVVGVIAGLATAAFDFYLAYRAFNSDEKILGRLYIANGILGASLALAGYMAATVFWPLFIVALILSLVIAIVKESPIKKWLRHCYFSADFDQVNGYATLEEELAELNSVLGG